MSKPIYQLPEDFCLPTCPFMKPKLDKRVKYLKDSNMRIDQLIISCENETLCKMWAEHGNLSKCNNCMYHEDSCKSPEPCTR
jgi:hypothetical protein